MLAEVVQWESGAEEASPYPAMAEGGRTASFVIARDRELSLLR